MFGFAGAAFLALANFGLAANANAQAPPGPLPGTASQDPSRPAPARQPRPDTPLSKNLAGTWKLNRDDSDDPRKKLQQARGGGRGQGGGRPGEWVAAGREEAATEGRAWVVTTATKSARRCRSFSSPRNS